MARSRLIDPALDLITDPGAVLLSLVMGEQLEFPVTLSFIDDATLKIPAAANYIYEAVVIEADNALGQGQTMPTSIKVGGVQTRLFVRIPVYVGVWSATNSYNKEEIVQYAGNSKYYKLLSGAAVTSSVPPSSSSNWEETSLSKIYVQFPKELGVGGTAGSDNPMTIKTYTAWTVQPTIETSVYGFFELRVTEPGSVFPRSFKPVRGLIQLQYSPSAAVTDATDRLNQTNPPI